MISGLASACSGPSLISEPKPADNEATAGSASSVAANGSAGTTAAGAPMYLAAGSAGANTTPASGGSAGTVSTGGSAGATLAGSGSGPLVTDPGSPTGGPPVISNPTLPGWTLLWSDDFNASDGTPVDASKWQHDTGGSGWGNQELEYYTDSNANSEQRGGNLVLTATRDGAASHSCWYGACQFTSARLLTSGKFSASYGRVEARIKMPAGKGLWPAFWMLGDNIATVGWPNCGEIDIMEAIGSDPATLHGSLHGPGYSGGSPVTATAKLPNAENLSNDFHTYAVEWAPDSVKFYLDATLYQKRTPADIPAGTGWVYNHPFFMLLNLAVGGQWPGSPDATTSIPTQMLVDYVRVYRAN